MAGHGHSHGCGGGHSHSHDDLECAERGNQFNLYLKINHDQVQCLNEERDGSGRDVFKPWDQRLDTEKYVQSDADEELLFNIPDSDVEIATESDDSLVFSSPTTAFKEQPGEEEDVQVLVARVGTKCPVTQQVMRRPVKNQICGHCYDRDGIQQIIINRAINARCPVLGCSNDTPLNMADMKFNHELFMYIRAQTTDQVLLMALDAVHNEESVPEGHTIHRNCGHQESEEVMPNKMVGDKEDVQVMVARVGTKCPVTQQVMRMPVRNQICGHCYDRDGIKQIINQAIDSRCPVLGCSNDMPLNMMDMIFDNEVFNYIWAHATDEVLHKALDAVHIIESEPRENTAQEIAEQQECENPTQNTATDISAISPSTTAAAIAAAALESRCSQTRSDDDYPPPPDRSHQLRTKGMPSLNHLIPESLRERNCRCPSGYLF